MKKIKILNYTLIVFIIIGIIGTISNMIFLLNTQHFGKMFQHLEKSGLASYLIVNLLSLTLLFGIYQIQQSFSLFLKNSFFNFRSALLLKRGGIILITVGLIALLKDSYFKFDPNEQLITNLIMYVMIVIFGTGLTAFSDIITRGTIIQEENDLTL